MNALQLAIVTTLLAALSLTSSAAAQLSQPVGGVGASGTVSAALTSRTVADPAPNVQELVDKAVERLDRSQERWNLALSSVIGVVVLLLTTIAGRYVKSLQRAKRVALRQLEELKEEIRRLGMDVKELHARLQSWFTLARPAPEGRWGRRYPGMGGEPTLQLERPAQSD